MSLFNWFFGKSDAAQKAPTDADRSPRNNKPTLALDVPPQPGGKPTPNPDDVQSERRVKRHARREQLYVAVRESMLRAGVLSSSYKFKVLSLDQQGDQFLVMIDVAPGLGDQADKLTEVETLLINTARSLFSIYVTSVYWRTDNRPAAANAVNFGVSPPIERGAQSAAVQAPGSTPQKSEGQRHEPIHDEELAAFKQAFAASSANPAGTAEELGKNRSGLRSFTLITGFEDTEIPEPHSAPALSNTQYGELR